MRESDWVSEGWKQAVERVMKVGARRVSQEGKKLHQVKIKHKYSLRIYPFCF